MRVCCALTHFVWNPHALRSSAVLFLNSTRDAELWFIAGVVPETVRERGEKMRAEDKESGRSAYTRYATCMGVMRDVTVTERVFGKRV